MANTSVDTFELNAYMLAAFEKHLLQHDYSSHTALRYREAVHSVFRAGILPDSTVEKIQLAVTALGYTDKTYRLFLCAWKAFGAFVATQPTRMVVTQFDTSSKLGRAAQVFENETLRRLLLYRTYVRETMKVNEETAAHYVEYLMVLIYELRGHTNEDATTIEATLRDVARALKIRTDTLYRAWAALVAVSAGQFRVTPLSKVPVHRSSSSTRKIKTELKQPELPQEDDGRPPTDVLCVAAEDDL